MGDSSGIKGESREEASGRYRRLVETSDDIVTVVDSDGTITYANAAVERVLGYDPQAVVGDTGHEYGHPEDREQITETFETVRSDPDESRTVEFRLRRSDGSWYPVEATMRNLLDDEHVGGVVVRSREMPERTEREQELRAREEKYRNLFEDTRDALMVLDRDSFLDCNERTLELFGIDSVDAFLDYSPWELSPPTQPDGTDSKPVALQRIETAFDEGEAFFEWTHQRVDGTEFPSEVKLSRFEYEGDPALHARIRDITDRKAYQRQLEEQRDNLDVLNQVLRHDVRNDIQLITAYAELVADESDDSDVQEYIETVLENANHAVELTSTARDMADVMLSTDEDLQRVRLERVLEDELDEVRSTYSSAVVRQESALPSCTVRANDMIGSVFRNLLKNAIQHNDEDVPNVSVSASDRGERVVVRISDNGPGVPDDRKDTIFGRGEKGLDSQGTGIGLYLVESLVDSYGGEVRVEDNDPTGASFVVTLPTAEP
jgi:PAS domain S-box-containing protein